MEAFFRWLPGEQSYENAIFDRWGSEPHRQEQLEMIQKFQLFSEENSCRVSFVSGDVHSAMAGYIKTSSAKVPDGATRMEQFVSSATVNVPPSKPILYILEYVFGCKEDKLNEQITARMVKFDGSNKRILGTRNFLSLCFQKNKSLRADWFTETKNAAYSRMVPPHENGKAR
jgi:hypothetical protein